MSVIVTSFFFFLLFLSVSAKHLPSFVKRCSKSDPNLNKCLDTHVMEAVRQFKAGNAELGINPLEPFFIESLELNNFCSSSVCLQQVYKNVYVEGLTNATIKNTEANFTGDNCYWRYKSYTPSIRLEADYTMTGKILLFPIRGKGKCTNTLYDIDGFNDYKCEKYTKKGKTHLRITSHTFKINPKRVSFNYENLISGNEKLNQELVKTVNENALAIYNEVGPAIEEAMGLVWVNSINRVFSRVPEDELFLP